MDTRELPRPIKYKGHLLIRGDERLRTLFPHVKETQHQGETYSVVPYGIDETKVLRNLGYDIAPPIMELYDWARTSPYHSQQVTAAMITMNPRSYVLNGLGCVDADTEVLTPAGWERIADWSGAPVAQYWPETGAVEFVENPTYVKLPCDEMVRIKTKYGVDQLLSPEHRVLLHALDNPGKREVLHAAELLQRHDAWLAGKRARRSEQRIGYSQAAIPVTFRAPAAPGLPLTDAQIRLQVAVHADGYIPPRSSQVLVRVKKERKKERMRRLLQEAGVEFSEVSKDYPSAKGFTVFRFAPPRLTKVYGDDWWCCTEAQLRVVAEEVMHWDGSISESKPSERFSTRSRRCADFVQYAFAATGRTARVFAQSRGGAVDFDVLVRASGRPLQLRGAGASGRLRSMWSEPSPDGFKYCFMVPSTFLLFRRNGCIFASGNTGKSRSALYAFDYLRQAGRVRKLLVTAPLSTLRRTWANEVFQATPHLRTVILHGDRAKRLRLLEEDADVYVINHDGVKTIQGALREAVAREPWMAVLDELTTYKNPESDISKQTRPIVEACPWAVGMTATPISNGPEDAYGQIKMMTPGALDGMSAGRFKHHVCTKISNFVWLPRSDAAERVHKLMQPSVRFTREEVGELPPCQYLEQVAELTPVQKELFREMAREGVLAKYGVTTENEADVLNKLTQILTGCVYLPEGKILEVDCRPRLELLNQVIAGSEGKVIVFTTYKHTLAALEQHVAKHVETFVVSGDVPIGQREKIFTRFQNEPQKQVIVAHPKTMSHGLTLTAANTIVWFGPPPSAETYHQANGRVTRMGQTRSQLIVNIVGTRVETKVYTRLRNREELQGVLLDLAQSQELETVL